MKAVVGRLVGVRKVEVGIGGSNCQTCRLNTGLPDWYSWELDRRKCRNDCGCVDRVLGECETSQDKTRAGSVVRGRC